MIDAAVTPPTCVQDKVEGHGENSETPKRVREKQYPGGCQEWTILRRKS